MPALVTRWLPGGGVTLEQMRTPGVMAQVAAMLRRLHATPALPTRVRHLPARRGPARAGDGACPTATRASSTCRTASRRPLTGPEHVPVSCHNDLLTANFVRDGARVCIVDWEYAGMNDRYFDLGNLSVNNGFEAEDDRALLELYFDEPVTERALRVAAAHARRSRTSARRCGASCSSGRSTLDFDYAAYATEHFERLERAAADPRVEEWLAVAATA